MSPRSHFDAVSPRRAGLAGLYRLDAGMTFLPRLISAIISAEYLSRCRLATATKMARLRCVDQRKSGSISFDLSLPAPSTRRAPSARRCVARLGSHAVGECLFMPKASTPRFHYAPPYL